MSIKPVTTLQPAPPTAPAQAAAPTTMKQPEQQRKPAAPQRAPSLQRAAGALPPPNGSPSAMRDASMLSVPAEEPGSPGRAQMMTRMQQSVGNARVSRMLGVPVRAKLTVNASGDVYEQEADRVADAVMRMVEPDAVLPSHKTPTGVRPAITRMLQRYEAPEHIDIGEAGPSVKVRLKNGLELDYSEISALIGDLYESIEKLDTADPNEVKAILTVIKSQRLSGGRLRSRDIELEQITQERERSVYDPKTGEFQGKGGQFREGKVAGTQAELETKSFSTLARHNPQHYAPENLRGLPRVTRGEREKKGAERGGASVPSTEGGWLNLHRQALEYARASYAALHQSDRARADELQRLAWLTNAGAAHFLQDAFAAGHLLNLAQLKEWMAQQWNTNKDFKERAVNRMRQGIHSRHWFATILAPAKIDLKIDAALRSIPPDIVAGAGVKVLHDYLNQNGIEVLNERGDRWRAYGDYNLWKSPDTRRFASETVALSKRQILDALAGKKPNPQEILRIAPANVLLPGHSKPVPVGTEMTRALMPVVENLLVSTDALVQLLELAGNIQEKAKDPFEKKEIEAEAQAQRKQRSSSYKKEAYERIEAHRVTTGDFDPEMHNPVRSYLDIPSLAKDLLGRSDTILVQAILDLLSSNERDDLALAFVSQIPKDAAESQLLSLGVPLLLRLQAELLTGWVSKDERAQAYRIASVLELRPDKASAGRGAYTLREAQVVIATVKGAASAIEETKSLKPQRVLDWKQAAAQRLIEQHSGFWGLDEAGLAAALHGQRADIIIEIIDQLEVSDDDDDVSLEYIKQVAADEHETWLRRENDTVLRRMRQALRAGSVAKTEEEQAGRIDRVLGAP